MFSEKITLLIITLFFSTIMEAQTPTGIDQYSFTAPEGWAVKTGNGYAQYVQPDNSGLSCIMTIFSPLASSGDMGTDTKGIFAIMFPGDWKYYYSDKRHDDLKKGNTKQGLEYCILEAPMVKERPGGGWDYQTGTALVVGMGSQMAVITIQHESTGLHCKCFQRYDYWGRFFNSFLVKNFTPKATKEDSLIRINGSWMTSGNRAIGEYLFAANGHYQYLGGYGNFTKISWNTVELKTSAFQGDGTYTIKNNQLILKRKGERTTHSYKLRFEKINQGSTGWKELIYLLNEKPDDGGPAYEVCYEKNIRQ